MVITRGDMGAEVRQEMRCFMESTSLKGAPRIMKSKNCYMRVFWIVIVVCLLITTVLFTIMLLLDYLKYLSVINLNEYIMLSTSDREELENSYYFTFPAVTVCNENPFRSNYFDYLPTGVFSEAEFSDTFVGQMSHLATSEEVKQDFRAYGYLIYIAERMYRPLNYYQVLGQTFDDFFVSCFFISNNNKDNDELPCRIVAEIEQRTLPHSLTCYKLEYRGSGTVTRASITGLSFILYLDNFSRFVPERGFDYMNDFQKQTGIEVITHMPHTHPHVFDAHSKFPPGLNVQLTVSTRGRKRLPPPYSDCDRNSKALYGFNAEYNSYTQNGCIMACEQTHITANCRCTYAPKYLFFDADSSHVDYTRYPFCHSVSFVNMSQVMARIQCAHAVISQVEQRCVAECRPNCTEIQFSHSSTAAQWPAKNTQLAFYNTAVATPAANSTRYEKFAPTFEPINQAVQNGNITQALHLLESTSLIDRNFVKVRVTLDQNNVLAFESQPMIKLNQFFSMLGGTLNLYAGITFVFLFELFELGIKICCNTASALKAKNKSCPKALQPGETSELNLQTHSLDWATGNVKLEK